MTSNKRPSPGAIMAAMMLATGVEMPLMGNEVYREQPGPLSDDEKAFLAQLERNSYWCWKRRFEMGLTKEQRQYVNDWVKS